MSDAGSKVCEGVGRIVELVLRVISLRAQTAVEIDLQEQTAYLIRNGRVALATPTASGRGYTILPDADADMPVPPGGKFIPAPMRYFMRFEGRVECTPVTCQATRRRTVGRTPRSQTQSWPEYSMQRRRNWNDPRIDPRWVTRWWWR